jgi:hypothetical protein
VWIAGGKEADGDDGKIIQWSQPEILLYDDDPLIRISYPDLIEVDGNYYITETQKDIARLHQIDSSFLNTLWKQFDAVSPVNDGLKIDWRGEGSTLPAELPAPAMPSFRIRDTNTADYRGKNTSNGFTIEMGFVLHELREGQVLADTRDASGKGWWISLSENETLEFQMNDGQTRAVWSADPGLLKAGTRHQVSIIVDGGPKIIAFVVDQRFNDGGEDRQFGWGRFSPFFQSAAGSNTLRIGPTLNGEVHYLRFFNRALMVTEALASQRFRE